MYRVLTDRRAVKAHEIASRLQRLAAVPVTPAVCVEGRVLTVAVRRRQACDDTSPMALLQYIHPWWTTIDRLGLQGTVLVAGWPADAERVIETHRIRTVPVQPGPRHIFHERHVLIRDYLRQSHDQFVLITDGSDVAFKRDPFALMRAAGTQRRLFMGREQHRIMFCRCVRREMRQQFGRVWFPLRPVLNPGIMGGRREVVLEALERIIEITDAVGSRLAASDMGLVNRAIHAAFTPDELITGWPLHSRFKGWEYESTAAILHK